MTLPPPSAVGRRSFLTGLAGAGALGLLGCSAAGGASGPAPAGPLPTAVPPGTELTISIRTTLKQLEASGELAKLPFEVPEWPNLTAGPDVIQAFRAGSVDLASNAGIPPIQAAAMRFDARIVAVAHRETPTYQFATAPGSDIRSRSDFRGRRIAFSQGQAQGVIVLRTLRELGLGKEDVRLVALNSPQFLTALQSGQVDVAVLAEPSTTKYLEQYGKDGARTIEVAAVDLLTVLWAPTSVLRDDAKAAAIRAFIPFWARGQVWAWEHPEQWVEHYYVEDQNLSAADGRRIVTSHPRPHFPPSWDRAVAWEQETADLLAQGGFTPPTKAADLFDRRFEGIAADSVPATYRSAP
ncbi:ABC transporter substrate-binding protein [Saccharothrix algeriensis]|uniref:ABC transporter substrate-binding protein n=1 Tax=Saccharothrix algeriensis TaxID=173560 RepID=A0A8T8I1N3_9PSEU|nr:ABC transporter substrate-binding protein [Saccharothrix algeriensis]MBM7810172.1 sulfonate transport system substrate-binding protein [Saccharothrix algeriensis]QTR04360.1 ABC transporter substrate-binding protein [Saccharothrix algeriensis]